MQCTVDNGGQKSRSKRYLPVAQSRLEYILDKGIESKLGATSRRDEMTHRVVCFLQTLADSREWQQNPPSVRHPLHGCFRSSVLVLLPVTVFSASDAMPRLGVFLRQDEPNAILMSGCILDSMYLLGGGSPSEPAYEATEINRAENFLGLKAKKRIHDRLPCKAYYPPRNFLLTRCIYHHFPAPYGINNVRRMDRI